MSGDRNQTRIRTRRLAISAILAAIGVVLLYIGALIEVLDLTVVVFASFVCVLAVIEMGGVWPWLIYATVSVLSLVLLPQKAPAVLFLLFGGYYPILKACFERWCPRIIAWIPKLVTFNLALTAAYFILKELFLMPDLAWISKGLWLLIVYTVGNGVFLLYDLALTRVISAYLRVYRERLRIRNW